MLPRQRVDRMKLMVEEGVFIAAFRFVAVQLTIVL